MDRDIPRRGILVAAALGAGASAIATAASFAESVGATPVGLYRSNRFWSSLWRLGGMPVEFVALVWFVALLLVYRSAHQHRPRLLTPAVFMTSAAVTGLGAWYLFNRNLNCWPAILVTGAAAAILLIAAGAQEEWTPGLASGFSADLRILSDPWRRVRVTGFLAVAVVVGAFVHVEALRVPREEAARRDLLRWYASAVRRADRAPSGGEIQVVIYTDYQCPFCRDAIPAARALVDQLRAAGSQIALELRDFPLEPECNGSDMPEMHVMACEAAAAAKFVRDRRSAADADALSRWMYGRGPSLSMGTLSARLQTYGLAEEFEQQYPAIRAAVASEAQLGRTLGVRATPTYFVNGVRLQAGATVFKDILEYEIRRQRP